VRYDERLSLVVVVRVVVVVVVVVVGSDHALLNHCTMRAIVTCMEYS
jgi:hypothetical protein